MQRALRSLIAIAAVAAVPAAATVQAKPFTYAYKGTFGEFDFSWSAEAAAVPKLVARLRAELAKEKAETIRGGKQDYAMHQIGWQSSTKIRTSGETPRLLSLSREYYAFTGGAHGNGATTGLLWDRRLGKEIPFATLFSQANAYEPILRAPYCRALDEQRKEKRGGDGKLGSVPEFDSCPALADLAIIPADSRHRGKLDRIHVIAAPYTAGPYVEGEYDTVLPVSRQLVAALKPEYRASFEAQRVQ